MRSAADLPYFEGDYWPNVFEESIKELDQEEEEKRKQAEAAEAAVSLIFFLSFVSILHFNYYYRYFPYQRKVKLVPTVRRKVRRRQRKAINRKLTNVRTVKNLTHLRRAMICQPKYFSRWRNTKKFSSLSGYTPCNQLQVLV